MTVLFTVSESAGIGLAVPAIGQTEENGQGNQEGETGQKRGLKA
jgi:hypothetical protein